MPQTSLLGDLIMAMREQATDTPYALPPPTNISGTFSADVAGFPNNAVVYVIVTQLTPWGESTGTEYAFTNATGSAAGLSISGTCSRAATQIKVYFTQVGSQLEDQFVLITLPPGVPGFVVSFDLNTVTTIGYPPERSSAWLPDTDGTAVSVSTMYRWINEALDAATAICDGIRDLTGVPSNAGQAQYQLIGNWRKMDSGFYDGYPFGFGSKTDIFRHSNVQGIVATMVMDKNSETQVVEIWPQANRTSGVGTLAGAITASATTLTYTPGAAGFVLGFGLALIGPYPADPSQCEIVYYSGTGSGSQLTQLTRGVGGTTPQAWPIGTQVSELNIFMSGTRNPQHYVVGQSAVTLTLPPSWIDALRLYLRARYKGAEQDDAGEQKLMTAFEKKCQDIRGTRPVMGPRQIQIGAGSQVETVLGAGSFFGGVILP
jgi:hypothetical protein